MVTPSLSIIIEQTLGNPYFNSKFSACSEIYKILNKEKERITTFYLLKNLRNYKNNK